MKSAVTSVFWTLQVAFQLVTAALLVVLGFAALLATIGAALGYLPWLDWTLSFGGQTYPEAGIALQITLTALAIGLLAYLPGNARVLALETSHRKFHLTMEDVTRAYRRAHAADRTGTFQMKSEFDSVRERIAYLRDHPDLADLEAPVIEAAAQMSHLSRDLARVYSDDSVARARDFLTQRQNEVEDFNRRLGDAKVLAVEIRRWVDQVEMDEAVAESQYARLCEELSTLLPELYQPAAVKTDPDTEAAWHADAEAERQVERDPGRDWLAAEPEAEAPETPRDDPDIVELLSRKAAQ